MRQLKITPKMIELHLAAYDDGIMRGLEELANGRTLLKRDMRVKNNHKINEWIKPTGDEDSWERLYLICCLAIYEDGRANTNLLSQDPVDIQNTVEWISGIEKYICNKFGEKSDELKSWKEGKEKIIKLVDYDKFSKGEKLVFKEEANTSYFQWEENPQWGGWLFLKQLGTATCCYCNSDGVFTLEYKQETQGKKKRKAQEKPNHLKSELDHFWPRAEFPFLGLSLYNLVPSCTRCNRNIKSGKYEPLGEMVHPYSHDFYEGAKFYAVFKGYKGLTHPNDTDVDVIIDRPTGSRCADLAKRAKKSAEFFHLEEVYNQIYELEVNDAVRKVLYFPESYLTDLRKHYPGIDDSVLNQMTLGTSLNPADINKLPHEKLRQDIHSQLWIHSSVTKSCTCGRTR